LTKEKISAKRIEDHIDTLQDLLEKYSQLKIDFFLMNEKNENFEKYIGGLERGYEGKIGV
jgi:hypothetical protein